MLEVADIFRSHGPAWRATAHLSLGQLKVMSAIEQCRTAALGGHVLRCSGCSQIEVPGRRIPLGLTGQLGAGPVFEPWGGSGAHPNLLLRSSSFRLRH